MRPGLGYQVRRWLLHALAEVHGLEGVQWHWSAPTDMTKVSPVAAWTGSPAAPSVVPAGHRAQRYRRRETINVPLVLSIQAAGETTEDAERRLWELYDVVDVWLADTDNVQATGAQLGTDQQIVSAAVSAWQQFDGPTPNGPAADIVLTISVTAETL